MGVWELVPGQGLGRQPQRSPMRSIKNGSQEAKRYLTLSRLVLTENSKRNVQAESKGFTKQYFDPITRKTELLAESAIVLFF